MPILPKIRDRRFITIRRGGDLTDSDHRLLALFSGITLEQLAVHKKENKDDSVPDPVKAIAVSAASEAAVLYGRPVVAEDAGIYFEAFDNFPAMNTKWIMQKLGYDGIFRLLSGKNRSAYFRTVIALGDPAGAPAQVFEGIIKGRISERVFGETVDCMDYDRIFIPEGSCVPFALMMDDKRSVSHRCIAFKKLGAYLSGE